MKEKIASTTAITALVIGCLTLYFLGFGLSPVIIIGGPGLLAVIFWYRTYLKRPTDPTIIVPLFLITAAGFAFHLVEEYLGHYAPAISRLFNIGWTDRGFIIVCFLLLGALCLVSVGLYLRKPLAGFVASLFFFTRLAELGLFVFPLLRPALQPDVVLRSHNRSHRELS